MGQITEDGAVAAEKEGVGNTNAAKDDSPKDIVDEAIAPAGATEDRNNEDAMVDAEKGDAQDIIDEAMAPAGATEDRDNEAAMVDAETGDAQENTATAAVDSLDVPPTDSGASTVASESVADVVPGCE